MDEQPNDQKAFLAEKSVYNNTLLRSELAQELISNKLGFMEKWGLFFFLGFLFLLLGSTWFIEYPDIIETRATLTSSNAPKELIVLQEGRLVRLFAHNNTKVDRGEVLGFIESTAKHEDVIELSKQIDSSIKFLSSGEINKVSNLFKGYYQSLGEIQSEYQQFINSLQLYNDYFVNGFYTRQKYILRNDMMSLENSKQLIESQKIVTGQDIKLAEESFVMNKSLYDDKVISKEEFRIEQSKFMNKQMAITQLESSLLSNESLKREKKKELDKLEHDIAEQMLVFEQALKSLKSSVDDWKKRFLIRAPLSGNVFFTIALQEDQFLQQGALIGYIGSNDSKIYAQANLPQDNFGKINTGLKVQLRFDAYPYQEVGYVQGTLDYVSIVPSDSGFLATFSLDRGLTTNNNKSIPYKSGLKAQAIIITRNMKLSQRLYQGLIKSTSVAGK